VIELDTEENEAEAPKDGDRLIFAELVFLMSII
jgi:hypothetical protein